MNPDNPCCVQPVPDTNNIRNPAPILQTRMYLDLGLGLGEPIYPERRPDIFVLNIIFLNFFNINKRAKN